MKSYAMIMHQLDKGFIGSFWLGGRLQMYKINSYQWQLIMVYPETRLET